MDSNVFYLLNLLTLSVFTAGIGFISGYGVCCEVSRKRARQRRARREAIRVNGFRTIFEAGVKAKKEVANAAATTK